MEPTATVLARERAALQEASRSAKTNERDRNQRPRALPASETGEVDRLRSELAKLAAQNQAYCLQLREARHSIEASPAVSHSRPRSSAAPDRDSEDAKVAALEAEVKKLKNTITELEAARFEPPELEELQILSGTLEAEKQELQSELQHMLEAKCEAERLAMDSRENASKVKSLEEKLQQLEAQSEQRKEELANHDADELEALRKQVLFLEDKSEAAQLQTDELEALRKQVLLSENNLQAAELRVHELESAAQLLALEKESSKKLQAELEDVKAELTQRMNGESVALKASNIDELQEKIHDLELENLRLSEQASAMLAEQLASRAISEAAHEVFQDLQGGSSTQEVRALPVPEEELVTKTNNSLHEETQLAMQARLDALELENQRLVDEMQACTDNLERANQQLSITARSSRADPVPEEQVVTQTAISSPDEAQHAMQAHLHDLELEKQKLVDEMQARLDALELENQRLVDEMQACTDNLERANQQLSITARSSRADPVPEEQVVTQTAISSPDEAQHAMQAHLHDLELEKQQLVDEMQARLDALELENQRLVDEMQACTDNLERSNQQLSIAARSSRADPVPEEQVVTQTAISSPDEAQHAMQAHLHDLELENQKLVDDMQARLDTLELENQQLIDATRNSRANPISEEQAVAKTDISLPEEIQRAMQARLDDLELENQKLVDEMQACAGSLELANQRLIIAARTSRADPAPEEQVVAKAAISSPDEEQHTVQTRLHDWELENQKLVDEMRARLDSLELENQQLIDAARNSRANSEEKQHEMQACLHDLELENKQIIDEMQARLDTLELENQQLIDAARTCRADELASRTLLEATLEELNTAQAKSQLLDSSKTNFTQCEDGTQKTGVDPAATTAHAALLEAELDELRTKCDELEIENSKLRQLEDSLMDLPDDSEQKRVQLTLENEELQRRCKVLESQVELLLQSNNEMEPELHDLRTRFHGMAIEHERLCQQQESLLTLKKDSDHKLDALASENEELQEKCKALEGQVERQMLQAQEFRIGTPLGSRHLQVPDSPSRDLPSSQEISPGSTKVTAVLSPPLTSRIPDGNSQGSELQIDSPGVYTVMKTVALTTGPDKKSGKIQNLFAGMTVTILEVAYIQDDKRVRGRVQDPEGWISLTNPEDVDMRWAERDLQKSNHWAVSQAEQIKMLMRSLEAVEETASAKTCPAVAETDTSELESVKATAAEDLARMEREVTELRTRLRSLENSRKEDALQIDSPGIYKLASDVDVFEGPVKGSQKKERLPAGSFVEVFEIVHRPQDRRVRGRIESPAAGWISLLDTNEGHRWASRELDATNEWISMLIDQASHAQIGHQAHSNADLETQLAMDSDAKREVLELRARSAAVEAHRDSLLFELDQLQGMQDAVADNDGAAPHSAADLHNLSAKILVLEAEKGEMHINCELLRARNAALEAELEDLGCRAEEALAKCEQAEAISAVSRGRALQAEELQKQIDQHVAERGALGAELARLRAENRVLAADAQGKLSSSAFSSSPSADLTNAERWVLYGESPNVATTSRRTYLDKFCVDFDNEDLMRLLGPLAAVNTSSRSSAIAAVESGEFARKTFKAYLEADKMHKGYLEYEGDGIRKFIITAFQKQNLTPPLETHLLSVYRFFDPDPVQGRLDAHACLCLADALLRALLRAGDSKGPHALQARLAAAERTAEQVVLGQALGPRVIPRLRDSSVPNGISSSEHAPSMASQCAQCGNVFAPGEAFCIKCGEQRRHVQQVPTGAPASCIHSSGVAAPESFRHTPDGHLPCNAHAAGQVSQLPHFQPQERHAHQIQQLPQMQQPQPRSHSVSRQLSVPLMQQAPQQSPKKLDPTRVSSVSRSNVASPGLRPLSAQLQNGPATAAAVTRRAPSFEPVTGPAQRIHSASALPRRQLEVFESAG
eukprot:TRINITY_DN1687_c0_g1_i1.p1 TRINITY_DN1687_c0_g1~~TRINITY_DN1687_c0_g1_i1.p1  ORF type:complete len:1958 (-),score=432.85 TRINITY_DN1687_c0_g1_i1:41-5773(-)